MVKKQKKANYLVCVNKEDYSKIAFKFAVRLAYKNKANVGILNVVEPSDYQSFGAVADKMRSEAVQAAEDLFKELSEQAFEEYQIRPSLLVREGLIEEEIIKLIEEDESINMLIVGTEQETSVKSKIITAIVSQLGSKIHIPMTIVPGNLTDQEISLLT